MWRGNHFYNICTESHKNLLKIIFYRQTFFPSYTLVTVFMSWVPVLKPIKSFPIHFTVISTSPLRWVSFMQPLTHQRRMPSARHLKRLASDGFMGRRCLQSGSSCRALFIQLTKATFSSSENNIKIIYT